MQSTKKLYFVYWYSVNFLIFFFTCPPPPPPFFFKKRGGHSNIYFRKTTSPPNACNVPGITIIMFFILYNMHNQEGQSEIKVKLNINVINVDLYFSHVHDSICSAGTCATSKDNIRGFRALVKGVFLENSDVWYRKLYIMHSPIVLCIYV